MHSHVHTHTSPVPHLSVFRDGGVVQRRLAVHVSCVHVSARRQQRRRHRRCAAVRGKVQRRAAWRREARPGRAGQRGLRHGTARYAWARGVRVRGHGRAMLAQSRSAIVLVMVTLGTPGLTVVLWDARRSAATRPISQRPAPPDPNPCNCNLSSSYTPLDAPTRPPVVNGMTNGKWHATPYCHTYPTRLVRARPPPPPAPPSPPPSHLPPPAHADCGPSVCKERSEKEKERKKERGREQDGCGGRLWRREVKRGYTQAVVRAVGRV